MPISVASPRNRVRLTPALRALVRAALRLEGRTPGEIAIVLTDDVRLRELNRRYRGIDRATDVLSFVYEEPLRRESRQSLRGSAPSRGLLPRSIASETAPAVHGHAASATRPAGHAGAPAPASGDLVISLERMKAQARRYRVTPGRELARLVIHGALHLAGLDHHRENERAHMRRREAQALRAAAVHVRALDRALAFPVPGARANGAAPRRASSRAQRHR